MQHGERGVTLRWLPFPQLEAQPVSAKHPGDWQGEPLFLAGQVTGVWAPQVCNACALAFLPLQCYFPHFTNGKLGHRHNGPDPQKQVGTCLPWMPVGTGPLQART